MSSFSWSPKLSKVSSVMLGIGYKIALYALSAVGNSDFRFLASQFIDFTFFSSLFFSPPVVFKRKVCRVLWTKDLLFFSFSFDEFFFIVLALSHLTGGKIQSNLQITYGEL